ncbi:hypothetical protein CD351_04190 [Erythrobacter sp. KY5]|uniref:hypothetical protein n=1 Tax=Erythrobacter sp. KY5 TaxID=2011159 RepID=UPI000DBF225C|nr:hypothetical protein [Erythrobacter sp. KY5]AWW73626.1 hypothetical protein CD351_04190 [Erythrobacter sp. KY5]
MNDTTRDSEQIMSAAKRSLVTQQQGGTHRPGPPNWAGSGAARRKNWIKRAKYFAGAILTIFISASIAGVVLNGIGFTGVMMVALAVMAAAFVFGNFPKVKVPKRPELGKGNPKQMVARTELWLEAQRASLPAPAVAIVDQLGVQLDALGVQLETLDTGHPAMNEVRELVGEYIPETIDNYRKIPAHLRNEEHAGGTADARLVTSLTKLSGEVDRVTRKLAEGALDDLAVKSRYLEYRYGGDELLADMTGQQSEQGSGVPLPDFAAAPEKAKEPR